MVSPRRSILNRDFGVLVLAVFVAFAVYYPFSPYEVQRREMATMALFFNQLKAEWAVSGHAVPLGGDVVTVVMLDIRLDQVIDDATWADLIARVRAKRDAYRHVSLIRVGVYDFAHAGAGSRFEKFDAK